MNFYLMALSLSLAVVPALSARTIVIQEDAKEPTGLFEEEAEPTVAVDKAVSEPVRKKDKKNDDTVNQEEATKEEEDETEEVGDVDFDETGFDKDFDMNELFAGNEEMQEQMKSEMTRFNGLSEEEKRAEVEQAHKLMEDMFSNNPEFAELGNLFGEEATAKA